MKLKIFTIDAFTKKPFRGNPAAVVPLDQNISEEIMQKVAYEMNLSETAFVQSVSLSQDHENEWKNGSSFKLRWFTPLKEVPLCGHATLATAHTLFNILGNVNKTVQFETLSGALIARKLEEGICLDFPANPPVLLGQEYRSKFDQLTRAVVNDLKIEETLLSSQTKKLLIRLQDSCTRNQLEDLNPSAQELLNLQDGAEVKGVIVTVKGKTDSEYDFLSRYFAPWNGIPEDPVTGSAHTVLGPYWSSLLKKNELLCRQCSPRGGDLKLNVRADNRIDMIGLCCTVICGEINI